MTTSPTAPALSQIDAAELPPGTIRATIATPIGSVSYASHVGLQRRDNNDHVAVAVGESFTALVVADGVGSEVEAREAAVIAAKVAAVTGAETGLAQLACTTAQHAVIGNFAGVPVWQDGTSTLTVVVLNNQPSSGGAWAEVAWLGDSSAWVLPEAGDLERVTTPHNPPDNPHFVLRHVLDGDPEVAIVHLDERPARWLLVCSDGLDGYVDHTVIAGILAVAESAEQACDALVGAALESGGKDNVTVIVADVSG